MVPCFAKGGPLSGYFDHVRCHNCNAQIDPERIEKDRGQMSCPACGEALKLSDLFGVKAQFMEEDGVQVGLDDLVPGSSGHFENPFGDGGKGHDLNAGSYKWADEEEISAYKRGFGPSAARGSSPMDSMDAGGERGEAPKGTKGVSDSQLPPGAVRARHIDPPGRSRSSFGGDDAYQRAYREAAEEDDRAPAAAEPEDDRGAKRRRFRGPDDQPAARPEDRALIRAGGGDDEDYQPHDARAGVELTDEDRKALEELELKKKKRRRF